MSYVEYECHIFHKDDFVIEVEFQSLMRKGDVLRNVDVTDDPLVHLCITDDDGAELNLNLSLENNLVLLQELSEM